MSKQIVRKKRVFIFDPDEPCCDEYEENTSHYHCGRCGAVTSLMGHYVGQPYNREICDPKAREAALDRWRRLDRAKTRVKAFIEMYQQLGQDYPKVKLEELVPDLELLVGEGE